MWQTHQHRGVAGSVQHAHLPLPLLIESKQVIQCPVVDASPLILLNVGSRHGVSLTRACLTIRKYAYIVACTSYQVSLHATYSQAAALSLRQVSGNHQQMSTSCYVTAALQYDIATHACQLGFVNDTLASIVKQYVCCGVDA